MKYFFLFCILLLQSCSFNNTSNFWTQDSIQKSVENDKLLEIKDKADNYKKMSFKEFKIFLKDYSKESDYPDINE
tara:strand:+ start:279 stop:503 length:225 start_codon:yes stop_codon:yes gene_type:complete